MSYPRDLEDYTDDELAYELARRCAERYKGNCDYCRSPREEQPCAQGKVRHSRTERQLRAKLTDVGVIPTSDQIFSVNKINLTGLRAARAAMNGISVQASDIDLDRGVAIGIIATHNAADALIELAEAALDVEAKRAAINKPQYILGIGDPPWEEIKAAHLAMASAEARFRSVLARFEP